MIKITDGTQGVGKVLTSDAGGLATWQMPGAGALWTDGGTVIYPTTLSDFVGIGIAAPTSPLHVKGSTDPLEIILENTGGAFKTGLHVKTASSDWLIGQIGPSSFGIKDNTANQERIRIDASGNVGIGTTGPSQKLDVAGSAALSGAGVYFWAGYGSNYIKLAEGDPGLLETYRKFRLNVNAQSGPITAMDIDLNGNVGIGIVPTGPYKLEVNGKVKSDGINETSDQRYKKNISTLENALGKVKELRGVNYEWRTGEFKDKNFDVAPQIGLIAQEVEKIIPQVVQTDANGYKSVEYSKLVALLIEAVKEQEKKIESLQSAVGNLQNENQSLKTANEKEMGALKADMKTLHDALDILLKENVSLKEGNK